MQNVGRNLSLAWENVGYATPRGVFLALRDGHVLPEAFLYGAAFVAQFARQRAAFLCGDYSVRGWVAFFPYTFLVKTTVAFLLLLALGLAAALRTGWRHALRRLQPLTPLLALFAVYWATSLASHLIVMKQGKVVEEGPAAELFKHPKTDYTRALFAAAFRLDTAPDAAAAAD